MARLSLLPLVVFFANRSGNSIRIQRDACDQLQEEVHICTYNAYQDYQSDMMAGEDGRPDWFARKACNYITATIGDCYGKLIGDCATEEEVNELRDEAIPGVLQQLSENNAEWDSEKCPIVKSHLDRVNPPTEEDEAQVVEFAAQNEEEDEEEEEEEEEAQTSEASEDSADDSENEYPDEDDTNDNEDVQDTEAGTEAAAAALSLVLVVYILCSA